jgi:putative sigma-54 modulation protein
MVITTTARHVEVDGDIRDFAEKRIVKLERYANDIHEAHLIVTAEKYRYVAEIVLRLNRHEMVAREETGDVRQSIDRAVERLEQQLRKLKEKRMDRTKKAAARGTVEGAQPGLAAGEEPGWDEGGLAEGSGAE